MQLCRYGIDAAGTACLFSTLNDRSAPGRRPPAGPPDGLLDRLVRDTCGAAAVEFALVGSATILTIVFIMMGGYLLYLGQALDRGTAVAARQIMIGAVQKANMGQSDFRTGVVCPALPAALACGNVIVNVQTVAEAAQPAGYYALVNGDQSGLIIPALSNAGAQFAPGNQGSYVYLQVIYPVTFLPAFMANLLGASAIYNGSVAYLAVSTAAFRNEQY